MDTALSSELSVKSCNSSTVCPEFPADLAYVKYTLSAEYNLSYCVRLEQASPVCDASPDLCNIDYAMPISCRRRRFGRGQALVFLPLSEPIFIGCVCGVLLLSLLLLLWTVVKCKKDQQTSSNPSPEPELIKERGWTIKAIEILSKLYDF